MTADRIDIAGLFRAHGWQRGGEPVTQLEHALQTAALVRRDGADEDLVLAALLHDVGHLVGNAPGADGGPIEGEDAGRHHGIVGSRLIATAVPPRVAWLVERHVAAKRYLCMVDPAYRRRLSPASLRSLHRQGGVLGASERAMLERHPWFADALRLRTWDDDAKVPGAGCPPLDAYRLLLERHFGPQSGIAAER